MKLEKSQACPWSNLGPWGPGRAQGRGGGCPGSPPDQWPAIGQPGLEARLWQTEAGFGKLSPNLGSLNETIKVELLDIPPCRRTGSRS